MKQRYFSPGWFLAALLTLLTAARADDVADFYKGKTLSIVVGHEAGGMQR